MPQYTITVSDEEYKALCWGIVDPIVWVDNAVHNKARQCVDAICQLALNDQSHTILTQGEKRQLVQYLEEDGLIINTVQKLPQRVKEAIVQYARIMTAAEREAATEP